MAIIPKFKYQGKKLSDLTFEKGLVVDLIKAKLTAAAILNPGTNPEVTKLVELEAQGTKDALLNFLTNDDLNFTISEMLASCEIETWEASELPVRVKIDTLLAEYGPLLGFLRNIAGTLDALIIGTPISDAVDGLEQKIQEAMKPVLETGAVVPKQDLKKIGGRSGVVKAIGHAHIGVNNPIPNSDTMEDENEFTKVKLFRDKIPEDIL